MPSRPLDRRQVAAGLALLAGGAWGSSALAQNRGAPSPPSPPESDPTSGMAAVGLIARRGELGQTVAVSGLSLGAAGERSFTFDQPFRVASVSKMFAGAAFVSLALDKGVSLDADVSDLLGFRLRHPAFPKVRITPRMVLSHTSGLRNGPSYPVPFGRPLSDAFRPGRRNYDDGKWFGAPNRRPGEWFAYADVNFALVAQMIERLSGRRFDLYMAQTLFAPAGLDIGYNWSGVTAATRLRAAPGLRMVNGRWLPQVDAEVPAAPLVALNKAPEARRLEARNYRLGTNGFAFAPQGGLRLCLRDMDRLAQIMAAGGAYNGRQLLRADALELMQRPVWRYDPANPNGFPSEVFQGYGLAMQTPQGLPGAAGDAFFGADSADWRGHLGDAYGWMTGLFWNIKDKRTIVWAVNGMPETERPAGKRSALTAPEEALIELAVGRS